MSQFAVPHLERWASWVLVFPAYSSSQYNAVASVSTGALSRNMPLVAST